MTRWQKTAPELRRSVIANLEYDAEENEHMAEQPWAGMNGADVDESRDRARAFRAAAAALRAAARGGR